MNQRVLNLLWASALLLSVANARAFYNPTTGRWLNRDPINVLTGTKARYELLRACGQEKDAAFSIASAPAERIEYVYVRNSPTKDNDLLGLCAPLPDSGEGTFTSNIWDHKINDGPASSLTFTVCCPWTAPNLVSYGLTTIGNPPYTPDRHPFPSGWTTQSLNASPPCYTIVINVPTRTAIFYPTDTDLVRVVGDCCCGGQKSGPTRTNPPPSQ